MAAMCAGLGLAEDHLDRLFGERRASLVKLIHYPTTPPGEAGVNSHHDAGFLTLLWQHRVGGLQALNPDGQWIDVPLRDHAIVVNLGEILQAMTGNYFVATTHRVIAHEERLSSGYFHGPDLRTSLDPLPLGPRFAEAVAGSPHHRGAGFMATRDELLGGVSGTHSDRAGCYSFPQLGVEEGWPRGLVGGDPGVGGLPALAAGGPGGGVGRVEHAESARIT
ncbi:MAG: 2OG-Fe(II) oxygenase family protein [Acidimicrobiia bacterium]